MNYDYRLIRKCDWMIYEESAKRLYNSNTGLMQIHNFTNLVPQS